jgi:hypothetical protein
MKWLGINQEIACRKIINCTNETHVINVGKYVDKVRHKLEYRARKGSGQ